MDKYFSLLEHQPLFAAIKKEEMGELLNCLGAKVRLYSKQDSVFMTGDKAEAVGIVLEGAVQVVKEDFWGNRTIIAKLGVEDMFGEVFACAKDHVLPVSVYAVEKSRIIMLNYRKMISTCSHACIFHNKLIENMLSILADKTKC